MPKFTRRVFIEASVGTGIEARQALGGQLCRCAADGGIIRTVKDTAGYLRGEAAL